MNGLKKKKCISDGDGAVCGTLWGLNLTTISKQSFCACNVAAMQGNMTNLPTTLSTITKSIKMQLRGFFLLSVWGFLFLFYFIS